MREKGGSEMLEAIQHSEFEEAISSDDALCQEETQFQIERQTYLRKLSSKLRGRLISAVGAT